jgi:hypothetical protein
MQNYDNSSPAVELSDLSCASCRIRIRRLGNSDGNSCVVGSDVVGHDEYTQDGHLVGNNPRAHRCGSLR